MCTAKLAGGDGISKTECGRVFAFKKVPILIPITDFEVLDGALNF